MRTTLAIDDANYERLQRAMHKRGCSFREVVNQSLRLGLDAIEKPARQRKRFVVHSFPGGPAPGVDWSCTSSLLSYLDDMDRR